MPTPPCNISWHECNHRSWQYWSSLSMTCKMQMSSFYKCKIWTSVRLKELLKAKQWFNWHREVGTIYFLVSQRIRTMPGTCWAVTKYSLNECINTQLIYLCKYLTLSASHICVCVCVYGWVCVHYLAAISQ